MLSGPRALASASEASDYLLHEYLVRNDKAHRTANRWHGGGAEALGLPERVSRRRFVEVLEGHVPGTDIRLGRVVDGKFQHRPGWDCTFSAPKSVSLEALLHDNKAVMRMHDASVRAALDWMEAEFLQTRGYDPATGRRPRVKADGLVATTFRHVASRNNDPQLHTHAVIANMTRNAAGEWRSVEPTLLRRNPTSDRGVVPAGVGVNRRELRRAPSSAGCRSSREYVGAGLTCPISSRGP